MANFSSQETYKLAVTASNNYATFDGGVQQVYLVADADCFVDFDAVTSNSSMLIKANLAPVRISFGGSNVQQIHAKTGGGSANLYILGVRGRA